MDTLDSQGKPINNGAPSAVSNGRSSGLAAVGPQILLQAESGKNIYPNYNANLVSEVSKNNQYSIMQPQNLSKNRSQRQHQQLSTKRNVVYNP